MSDNNGWDEHKMHVMNCLSRLEETQELQTTKIGEIHTEIVGFKTDQKWEFRILSVLWGLVVTGINLFIKYK